MRRVSARTDELLAQLREAQSRLNNIVEADRADRRFFGRRGTSRYDQTGSGRAQREQISRLSEDVERLTALYREARDEGLDPRMRLAHRAADRIAGSGHAKRVREPYDAGKFMSVSYHHDNEVRGKVQIYSPTFMLVRADEHTIKVDSLDAALEAVSDASFWSRSPAMRNRLDSPVEPGSPWRAPKRPAPKPRTDLSPRAQVAEQIAAFVRDHDLAQVFGGESEKRGRYRSVGFSLRGTVDGEVRVYSPKFILVRASNAGNVKVASVDAALQVLRERYL